MYVIVRKDIPQPYLTVQACHAAIAATYSYGRHCQPHLVLCAVDDENQLNDAFNRLKEQGVPCCSYSEPDFGYQVTAVATAALSSDERRPLRRFKLLE